MSRHAVRVPVIASVHDARQEVNVHGATSLNIDLDHKGELDECTIRLLRASDELQGGSGGAHIPVLRLFEQRLHSTLKQFAQVVDA
jgi:hypothetical protein